MSNQSHIYKSQRYVRKRVIHSDYDSFLESFQSEYLKTKVWQLPPVLDKKNIEDIPSKKRSQYLKKLALLESIKEEIISSLKK